MLSKIGRSTPFSPKFEQQLPSLSTSRSRSPSLIPKFRETYFLPHFLLLNSRSVWPSSLAISNVTLLFSSRRGCARSNPEPRCAAFSQPPRFLSCQHAAPLLSRCCQSLLLQVETAAAPGAGYHHRCAAAQSFHRLTRQLRSTPLIAGPLLPPSARNHHRTAVFLHNRCPFSLPLDFPPEAAPPVFQPRAAPAACLVAVESSHRCYR